MVETTLDKGERRGGGGVFEIFEKIAVPIFPIKIGGVCKIGGIVLKKGGYDLFSY